MTKELEQLSYIKDIQKYTVQMGQVKFDQRFSDIIAALKEAHGNAREEGATSAC